MVGGWRRLGGRDLAARPGGLPVGKDLSNQHQLHFLGSRLDAVEGQLVSVVGTKQVEDS